MRHKHTDSLSDLDPIDGDRLADAWSGSRAQRATLEEITTMSTHMNPVENDNPTPARTINRTFLSARRIKLVAVSAFVAVVLAVGQTFFSNDSRAFAVNELPNGVLEIDGAPQFRDGEELAAELKQFGIDVKILTLPSSPSAVGVVTVWDEPADEAGGDPDWEPEGLTTNYTDDGKWKMEIDPFVFKDQVTIQIQVEAEKDEPYRISEEVFEQGEVLGGLHCVLGEEIRADELVPYLSELGITPVWKTFSPVSEDDPNHMRNEEVESVPQGQIYSGYSQDATTVEFSVLPDGVTLHEDSLTEPRLSDHPCTPEQSAAWD